MTALQSASKIGDLELVELFIQGGADVHAPGGLYQDASAIHAAAEKGHVQVVRRLIEAGADVNAVSWRKGQTAIQSAARNGHEEMVQTLRELGAVGRSTGGSSLFP